MSKRILKTGSVPADMSRMRSQDDTMDEEFDKIFHPEKYVTAIPSVAEEGPAKVDQERQKYYRSASVDESSLTADPDPEQEDRKENAKREFIHDEGSFNVHSKSEFAHNHPIMTKMKTHGHEKHRKLSSDPADNVRKKSGHRKPSSKVEHNLVGIPEGEQGGQEVLTEEEESAKEEEETSNLPWKTSHAEPPKVYKETLGSDSPVMSQEKEEQEGRREGVKFTLGLGEEEEEEGHHQERKRHHRRSKKPDENIQMGMRRAGSELHDPDLARSVMYEELDENGEVVLLQGDLDNIGSRRFEKPQGLMKHKIQSAHKISTPPAHEPKTGLTMGDVTKPRSYPVTQSYGYRKDVDHTPHELFVEMDELEGEEWVERSRWIKYEEDLEADVGRWGKPHVSSLSFHSLINLRKCLENGTMMLDISARDLPQVLHRVVEDLSEKGIIVEEQKSQVLRVLLYRHKHVHPHTSTFKFGLKRSLSQRSIQGLLDGDRRRSSMRTASMMSANQTVKENGDLENGVDKSGKDQDHLVDLDGQNGGLRKVSTHGSFKRNESFDSLVKARKQDILSCLEEGTEGCVVLVGSLEDIDHPIVAFVRMGEALVMPNTIEVSLPVRFIFILLTPTHDLNMDHHEIGRAFSTLMSNPSFHNVCYGVQEKRELLHAINEFLDESVVLPPGDWDKKNLLPMSQIMEMRRRAKERKGLQVDEKDIPAPSNKNKGAVVSKKGGEEEEDKEGKRNPLARTSIPFGGLIDDIKYRHFKSYLSDITDGLNAQCVAATIFIYFAALSGAIAFGGLMGAKTGNLIGISETLILTSVMGVAFGLFAGCPLIIIGTTGPVLLYDEALYNFCLTTLPDQFLAWRTWIGIWTFVISLIVAGLQGSTIVKFFTKFTKDIFNSLVSLLFIYEALRKLVKIFIAHPLVDSGDYCEHYQNSEDSCISELVDNENSTESLLMNSTNTCVKDASEPLGPQPNTALLSFILMFGTFFIAYFLRNFRNSNFLGRTVRRALGDFGVPIAIVLMVLVDFNFGDTYTEKLSVPSGIQVTNSTARGWIISPTGTTEHPLAIWAMFAAILPALLLYMLLFMETHICELIMMEKTKAEKGAGVHLDIVLLSLINLICGIFGGPWICAATVRAVSHVSALTVMSTVNIPGEAPKVVGVRDQRVTATMVNVLLGLSILMSPILKLVPFAVLFGVFLYMGVAGMNGVQFFDRLTLFIKPVKYHPNVSYVKRVPTWRMVLFTTFQILGLVVLWVVKSSAAALAFPFFVMLMIPYRFLLKYIFTPCELEALDGASAGKSLSGEEEDETDFYATANEMPITPATQAPLHRSVMALAVLPTRLAGETNLNFMEKDPALKS